MTATANSDGTISLSWTAPGLNLWYWIYYKDVTTGQSSYTRTADPVTTGTSFTMSYLTLGDVYAFYVMAINAGGEGPASNTVQATPYLPPPGAPTNLHAAAGNGKVSLSLQILALSHHIRTSSMHRQPCFHQSRQGSLGLDTKKRF